MIDVLNVFFRSLSNGSDLLDFLAGGGRSTFAFLGSQNQLYKNYIFYGFSELEDMRNFFTLSHYKEPVMGKSV